MTDSPGLIVSGGGSVAVSSDAMLADAERLHLLALALPTVSHSLRGAAALAGRADAVSLGSWRAREADAGIDLARRQLDAVIEHFGRMAEALDAAAIAYGNAEREAAERFISLSEQLADRGGALVGATVSRNRGVALLMAALAASALRELLSDPIGPNDVHLPTGLNELVSDPRVVRMLRALVMAGDDFVDGVVETPSPQRDSTTEVGLVALVLLSLGSAGSLFATAPVVATAYGPRRPTTTVSTLADRAARVPSAVAGDVPQVRIDRYTQPGLPARFEVYIGGTVDFSPVAKGEPFDLTSSLQMEAGLPAGAYAGVQEAMSLAGVTAESPVVITGHSQGGLIASRLAASGQYSVEALVTFGAPAGQVVIPSGVPALIVENTDDIVPALGGVQANRDALLVQARAYPGALPAGLALPAHRIEAYRATAEAIDERAQSGRVVEFRQRLSAMTSAYGEGSSQYYLVERTG